MRYFLGGLALIGLAACDASIPESGVGFGDYADYRRQQAAREAALAGNPLPAPLAVSEEQLEPSRTGVSGTVPAAPAPGENKTGENEAERIAAATAAALNSGQTPVQASPQNPAPAQPNSPGISSENDFGAVSAERSIESDAERLAQNRAQYQVIQPTALPSRDGAGVPNIVEYALNSTNPVGNPIYRRVGIGLESKNARNCAKYASPDRAQEAFLANGGPGFAARATAFHQVYYVYSATAYVWCLFEYHVLGKKNRLHVP